MATKLGIYNHALQLMKERRIPKLTEDRESRRILDDFYDDCVQFCLEQGLWKFALRSANLAGDSGNGAYGFTYRHTKPSDFVHLYVAAETSDFDPPLVYNFIDEAGYFYSDSTPLRIRYTSNDASYGGDLSLWPTSFTVYVATELASWAGYAVTGNGQLAAMLEQKAKMRLANALSLCAMVGLPGFLPMNTYARTPVAAEEVNVRPEVLPFGSEVKAILQRERR